MIRRAAALALLAASCTAIAQDDEGRRLFTTLTPACALCHTLKDAGATGQIGPSLDELKPDAARVMRVLRTGIGVMPAFTQLTDEQVRAIAGYVERAAGK